MYIISKAEFENINFERDKSMGVLNKEDIALIIILLIILIGILNFISYLKEKKEKKNKQFSNLDSNNSPSYNPYNIQKKDTFDYQKTNEKSHQSSINLVDKLKNKNNYSYDLKKQNEKINQNINNKITPIKTDINKHKQDVDYLSEKIKKNNIEIEKVNNFLLEKFEQIEKKYDNKINEIFTQNQTINGKFISKTEFENKYNELFKMIKNMEKTSSEALKNINKENNSFLIKDIEKSLKREIDSTKINNKANFESIKDDILGSLIESNNEHLANFNNQIETIKTELSSIKKDIPLNNPLNSIADEKLVEERDKIKNFYADSKMEIEKAKKYLSDKMDYFLQSREDIINHIKQLAENNENFKKEIDFMKQKFVSINERNTISDQFRQDIDDKISKSLEGNNLLKDQLSQEIDVKISKSLELINPSLEKLSQEIDDKIKNSLELINPALEKLSQETDDKIKNTLELINPALEKLSQETDDKIKNSLELINPALEKLSQETDDKIKNSLELINPALEKINQEIDDKIKNNLELINPALEKFNQEIDDKVTKSLEIRLNDIKDKISVIEHDTQKFVNNDDLVRSSHLLDLVEKMNQIRQKVSKIESNVLTDPKITEFKERSNPRPQQSFEIYNYFLELEYKALYEVWIRFEQKNKELINFAISLKQSDDYHFFSSVIAIELLELLKNKKVLFNRYAGFSDFLKDYYSKISNIVFINEIISLKSEMKTYSIDNIPKEIVKIRKFIQLLTELSSTDIINKLLNFKPSKWVRESFIDFADMLIREYQKDKFENNEELLSEPYNIVCKALLTANLKPIDIVLGKTRFDSSKHIGRTTVKNPKIPDYTIASIIRSGFVQLDGRIFRQPEVSVNKI